MALYLFDYLQSASLNMNLSEACPVLKKAGFEMRERRGRDYQRGWWSKVQWKSIPQRGTYARKGASLCHRGPCTVNKEVKPIVD